MKFRIINTESYESLNIEKYYNKIKDKFNCELIACKTIGLGYLYDNNLCTQIFIEINTVEQFEELIKCIEKEIIITEDRLLEDNRISKLDGSKIDSKLVIEIYDDYRE